MAVKRKCVCCGKEYEYCPTCAKKDQPQWMVTFCSEPCKELFNIVSAYNMKRVGKAAVQKYVAEHPTTGKYTEPIQKVLDEAVGIVRALGENQRVEPSITDAAKKAETVIPMHKMESQSRKRFKRRGRR